MYKNLFYLIAGLLSACTSSSGVLQLAPNTYTISAGVAGTGSVSGNDTQAKREALVQANQHCNNQGKQIIVENTKMSSTYAGSTSELIFKCLTDAEANIQSNTKYRKEADVVIENRK